MQYTLEQVLQLAPDDASAKAGQQLASKSKWVVIGRHEKALWGDCQGSGKTPYKTAIDVSNIAFKCSCPSRKFPCKHGLGLLLLYVQQPGAFAADDLPDHVQEWLGKREGKEASKEQKEGKPVDEAAKAKRAESREKKVSAGMEELRYWIKDVVRTGIMNVPQQAYDFNKNIISRMVDAQASGLAGQLRQINQINYFKDGWQKQLIKRLSAIYLVTEAYNNADRMSADWVRELQTLIGWTTPKEEVLQSPPVNDAWVVLSVTTTEEGNLSTERCWFYGTNSGRFALLLNFYAGNQQPQHTFFPGLHLKGDMVFFPGVRQMRALVKEHQVLQQVSLQISSQYDVSALYEQITQKLAQNPFSEQMPFVLGDVRLGMKDDRWFISDGHQKGFYIANLPDECWRMLAFCGGKAFSCFGVYALEQFQIHTLLLHNKICFVK